MEYVASFGRNKGYNPGLIAATVLSPAAEDVKYLYPIYEENEKECRLDAYLAELLRRSPEVFKIFLSIFEKKESYENPIKLANSGLPIIELSVEQKILDLFDILVQKNNDLKYIYEQLRELLYEEDEDDEEEKIEWSYTSFKSLCDFCSNPKFACMDVSLDVTSDGEACVQRTYKNSYVFILFKEEKNILYKIVTKNYRNLRNGTFDDFFRDIKKYPVGE